MENPWHHKAAGQQDVDEKAATAPVGDEDRRRWKDESEDHGAEAAAGAVVLATTHGEEVSTIPGTTTDHLAGDCDEHTGVVWGSSLRN